MIRKNPHSLISIIAVLLVIDLFMNGNVTWSRWVVLVVTVDVLFHYYRMDRYGSIERAGKELTLLNERYAKGEMTEEDYVGMKEQLKAVSREKPHALMNYFIGIFLIIIAVILLMNNFFHWRFSVPWVPLLIIFLGLIALFRRD